ncbi:pyridoxamine 5'-phosphate oxidase family protein [Micromonospora echinofusca]|uniref:Pyridoxamine 5'-phosphate oxidase family protein n=1 Tax=Micromonospora echinofusca TaxID=47858 RepID=A0ABS3VZ81_MICEH|nr:pyridoxamine 5'-phosphate oxidase family protein [Micromonospora echinofusca]MBO4209828.1 pyridoxamine 5'-phosphate oxidase family protein [Micromonospora echinofusca]
MHHDDAPSDDDARARITELVRDARICMLTTTDLDGRQVSRPMVLQKAEFDGDLWFFTHDHSAKIRQIRVNPQVNIAFSSPGRKAWVSVSGTAAEAWRRDRAERLWHPLLGELFPDGPDTPGITLLKVHAGSAEYWESPGGTATSLLGYARAVAADRRADVADVAENRTVGY